MVDANENSLNLNNLIKIKEYIIQLIKSKDFNKDKLKEIKINDSIHDVGISLSIRNKFSNDKIINFIEKDIYYMDEKYDDHSKRDPNVFKYFQIDDEKKSGFSKFVELKLYSKFKKDSKAFYKIFIDKILTLDDISLLFELFPKEELDADFINVLLDKIPKLYQLGKHKDTNQLFENMLIIIPSMIIESEI